MTTIAQWSRFECQLKPIRQPHDPLRDTTLTAEFIGPDRARVAWRGYYAGRGRWGLRFMPSQIGVWHWRARFEGESKWKQGTFRCIESDLPGPLGRYAANPIWFGDRSGRPVLVRSFHVGDRFFASNFSDAGRNRFLSWARQKGYNLLSIASFFLNRNSPDRGAGWKTPRLWDERQHRVLPAHYDAAEKILDELAAHGFWVYPFAGFFGRSSEFPRDPADQELYMSYTLARFGPYWNLLLNVAGPEPLWVPEGFYNAMPWQEIDRLGRRIKELDIFGHLLSIHNPNGDDPFRFMPWTDYVTLQGNNAEKGSDWAELRRFLLRNQPGSKPVYAQEVFWPGNQLHFVNKAADIRRKAFTMLFSAATINYADMAGLSSSGYSGTLNPADRDDNRHLIMQSAWDWFEANVPYSELRASDRRCPHGACLANESEAWFYVAKAPAVIKFKTDFTGLSESTWYNPRNLLAAPIHRQCRTDVEIRPPDSGDWIVRFKRVVCQNSNE